MSPAAVGRIGLAACHADAGLAAAVLAALFLGAIADRLLARASTGFLRVSIVPTLLGLGIVLVDAVDVLCYRFFVTRLYARDVVLFASEVRSGLTLLSTGWKTVTRTRPPALAVMGALLVVAMAHLARTGWLLLRRSNSHELSWRWALPRGGIVLALGLFYWIPLPSYVYAYVDKPLYENVFQRNASFFVDRGFSPRFRAKLLAEDARQPVCAEGRNKRLNVVVVIVESLSAYHSKLFSGLHDWTPQLDRIASRGTALKAFHANGWTTIGGLVALLTRSYPLVPEHAAFNEWGSPRFDDFEGAPDPVPRAFAVLGYDTTYLGAGDISFLGQDSWLRRIGFARVSGHEDPRFASQRIRGPFDSVPDDVLYRVAWDEIARASHRPLFMVVQTFWSHRPFMAPDGRGVDTEEYVIRESDKQLGRFYDRLESTRFLENGLVVIVGDHRAAEPFDREEFHVFGKSAVARIPAVAVTQAFPLERVSVQDFQQRDLGASLASVMNSRYCLGAYEGTFLAPTLTAPGCVVHARGDDRDLIYVKCGREEATVRVAGDATHFVEGSVPSPETVLTTINRARARPPRVEGAGATIQSGK